MKTEKIVKNIIQNVKKNGDESLRDYNLRFDNFKATNLKVTKKQILGAYNQIDKNFIRSLKIAKRNIEKFNKNILNKKEEATETSPGVKCWREFRPIEKVGLYVPGGLANYPSTVLMLGIPARIAGCKKIIICSSPPIPSSTLVAADILGINEIYQVGGAQAIVAMAYGTKTIPKVDKIFGPGNKFVTEAKIQVSNSVGIDMPAGPSEIAILADKTANFKFIEADLKSQLEHGPNGKAWLITTDKKLFNKIDVKNTKKYLVKNISEGIDLVNKIAPEHIEVIVKNENQVISKIINAGSVFVGDYSPVPAGDYATGPNHTLPTSGWAKSYSALSVEDFGKKIEFQKVSKKGLANLKDNIIKLAETEGFKDHASSIKIRFNKYSND
ncbi:MAG: histidinol dehydrogenase [Patescibacteria group bacterium]